MKCPNCHFDNLAETNFCGKCGTQLDLSEEISSSKTKTLHFTPRELTRGTTFASRYEIIEELGRGGMGEVYRVFDKKIEEEVALKLLKPEIASNEKMIKRFKNELKFARKISHRNVCRMYDLSEGEGTQFITMEYVPGENLKSFIRRSGQLTVGKAVSIAKQVCEGLAEAHKFGVVHRDLKSRNIMIDREGNTRIMDFGIARSLEAKGITGAKVMIGTPQYMSPEQVEGKEADQRSDLYSMGVVLYEMVTGKLPFEGDTALSIALKHKIEPPPEPREFNPQVPSGLSRMILKCMEKDREKRYQEAEEILLGLREIEKEIPTKDRILPKRKEFIPTKLLRTLGIPGIILLFIMIIVIGFVLFDRIQKSIKPESGEIFETRWKNSIAVLPFEDLSPQRDQEHLCEGMLDDIITKLSSLIPELKVIPKLSVRQYKDTDKDIKEIGKNLEVATVLEPSLQIENNMIRVNVKLIGTKDGFLIWSKSYQKKLKSYFEVQDEISRAIAEALQVRLLEDRFQALKKGEPTELNAYVHYRMGKHYIEEKYIYSYQEEDFEAGVRFYQKAIEIEPDNALAYLGLGLAYEVHFNWTKDEKLKDLMIENIERAYELNPNLAESNVGMGWIYFYKEDNDRAYQNFKRAFELDPNNPSINFNVGSFLRSIGLYQKAIKYYSRAIEFSPLFAPYEEPKYKHEMPVARSMYHMLLANCYMYIGEFEKAADLIQKALSMEPNNIRLHLSHARQLIMMKKYDEAAKTIAKAEIIEPNIPGIQYYQAWILAGRGEREKALELIKDAENTYLYHITSIYSLLGLKDEAIKNIQVGIETGFEKISEYLYSYPILMSFPSYDSLRDEVRFKEIVKQEKKKYEEKLRKYSQL